MSVVLADQSITPTSVTFDDGESAPYADGPMAKSVKVANMVITDVTSNVGNPDYFMFDPKSGNQALRNPTIRFTIDDAGDPGRYRWQVRVRPTNTTQSLAFMHGLLPGPGVKTVTINAPQAPDTQDKLLGDAEWGTETFDIEITKVAIDGTLLDHWAYKAPWKLTVPPQMPGVVDGSGTQRPGDYLDFAYSGPGVQSFDPGCEDQIQLSAQFIYCLEDAADVPARSVHVDLLNSDLSLVAAATGLPTIVNVPHLAISVGPSSGIALTGGAARPWIAVLMAEDGHGSDYRDHKNKHMLAANDRQPPIKAVHPHFRSATGQLSSWGPVRTLVYSSQNATSANAYVAVTVKVGDYWYGKLPSGGGPWFPALEGVIRPWPAQWATPNLGWFEVSAITERSDPSGIAGPMPYGSTEYIVYRVAPFGTLQGWGGPAIFTAGTTRLFVQYLAPIGVNIPKVYDPLYTYSAMGNALGAWTFNMLKAPSVPEAQSLEIPDRAAPIVAVATRSADYTDPNVQWALAWKGVPFVFPQKSKRAGDDRGASTADILNFLGTDCAGLVWGAHRLAYPSDGPLPIGGVARTNAQTIWQTNTWVHDPANGRTPTSAWKSPADISAREGDILFWWYTSDQREVGHVMLSCGGQWAIEGSAGTEVRDSANPGKLLGITGGREVKIIDVWQWFSNFQEMTFPDMYGETKRWNDDTYAD